MRWLKEINPLDPIGTAFIWWDCELRAPDEWQSTQGGDRHALLRFARNVPLPQGV